MRTQHALAATVLMLGLLPTAKADLLAAGALYGGNSQNQVVCYLFNAGGATVTISTNQIIRQDGVVIALIGDDCSSLAPGKTCGIVANIVGTLAHSCKMVISPSASDVRGTLEIRQGLSVLQSLPLR